MSDDAPRPRSLHTIAQVGRALRMLRRSKGLSQPDVTEATGIRSASISAWERGGDLRVTSLMRLLAGLHCRFSDLARTLDEIDPARELHREVDPILFADLRTTYPEAPRQLVLAMVIAQENLERAVIRSRGVQELIEAYSKR